MPREGALDSAFLVYTSKMVVEQVERLSSGFKSYDPTDFGSKIKDMLGTESGIEKLARLAKKYSLGTDRATFMLGPMDIEVKERAARRARQKDKIEVAVRPEEVENLEADQKNESTKRVELLHEYLHDADGLNYWRFVYDGDAERGFGRTIQNIFYSSFLVRDGHASLDVDDDQPLISQHEAPTDQDYVDNKVSKHQCVVQFNYAMWLALRARFSGESSYLPPPNFESIDTTETIGATFESTTGATTASSSSSSAQTSARNSNLISPKKRAHSQIYGDEEEDAFDEDVSQVAATPEFRMPKVKRPRK